MSVTDQLHTHVEPHAHGHAGSGLFSRRIGPLSAGAWLAVIVGGVALGMYAKKHGPLSAGPAAAATDPTATDPNAADPAADPGGLHSSGAAPDTGSSSGGSSSGGSSSGSSTGPTDNGTWEQAAIKALIVNGIRPGVAQPAVVGFLSGTLLTAEQGAAVELAIRLIGAPPEGAPALMVEPGPAAPTPSTPAPTSTSPAPSVSPVTPAPAVKPVPHVMPRPTAAPHPGRPVAGHASSYTVKSGDTLTGIADREHVASWQALYAANADTIEQAARRHGRPDSGGGHWIYPGTVLRLP